MTTRTGGCLCGAVRFELSGDPMFQFACHCSDCQRTSGGAPTYGMIVPKSAVTVTKGAVRTYWVEGDSGGRVGRQFCETCGSPLFSEIAASPEILGVKVGGLDDSSDFKILADIWTQSAPPWHHFEPGAAQMARGPGQ